MPKSGLQNVSRNDLQGLIRVPQSFPDTISWWADQYFRFEVTTAPSSQRVQRRDFSLFVRFMIREEKIEERAQWSPRVSAALRESLRLELVDGKRHYSDRTINRIMAHLKTFSKWVHKVRPFPLGDPMQKLKLIKVGTGLEIERALTESERRRILDAADMLTKVGGRSQDRNRYKKKERPARKGYRPLRNRAIIYALVETGMRRAATTKLDLISLDAEKRILTVEEKGGLRHGYHISQDGLNAIQEYLLDERQKDAIAWNSPALFLSSGTVRAGNGRLTVRMINEIWNDVCVLAGVSGKTPHSARHAMGRYIIRKTGNIEAVQRQLGHRNATYSMQYSRITDGELDKVIDER